MRESGHAVPEVGVAKAADNREFILVRIPGAEGRVLHAVEHRGLHHGVVCHVLKNEALAGLKRLGRTGVGTAIPEADPVEESAPPAEATAEVPDNPFAALLEVGVALLKQAMDLIRGIKTHAAYPPNPRGTAN